MTEVQSYQMENCQLQKPLHLVCTGRTLHYKIFGVNLSEPHMGIASDQMFAAT